MSTATVLYYMGYLFFNPLAMFVYLLAVPPVLAKFNYNVIVSMPDNNFKVQLIPLFISVFIISSLFLIMSFLLLSSIKEMTFIEFLHPKSFYVSMACFTTTLFTLYFISTAKGLEANVFGFIFAPALVTASVTLLFLHFSWVWKFVIKG